MQSARRLKWTGKSLFSMLELIEAKNFDALTYHIAVRATIIFACWVFMVVANMVDFWSGTTTAKALHQKLWSHGFRRTITKIDDYARLMLFALMFDVLGSLFTFYIAPFGTILCTIAIMCIEGKSVIENSRRKKAHAAQIPDIVKQIIEATTEEQGRGVLKKIAKLIAENKNESK